MLGDQNSTAGLAGARPCLQLASLKFTLTGHIRLITIHPRFVTRQTPPAANGCRTGMALGSERRLARLRYERKDAGSKMSRDHRPVKSCQDPARVSSRLLLRTIATVCAILPNVLAWELLENARVDGHGDDHLCLSGEPRPKANLPSNRQQHAHRNSTSPFCREGRT